MGNPKELKWAQALASAKISLRFSDLTVAQIEELAENSRSPEEFNCLMRVIYAESKRSPGRNCVYASIEQACAASCFSMRDWISAVHAFCEWTSLNDRKVTFEELLTYLKCTAELPDAKLPDSTFHGLVRTALDVYGLDT